MDWKALLNSRAFRAGLCGVLILCIVLGIFLPGLPFHGDMPADPTGQQELRDIEAVRLGDEEDGNNAIIVPVEGGENAEETRPVSEGGDLPGEGESETGETQPEEMLPIQVEGDKTDQEQSSTGSGDQGQEDGNSGEEGGEETVLDLAMVLTWQRYGKDPTTIVCSPYNTVSGTINLSQLDENVLEYGFSLTGEDSKGLEITNVTVFAGNEVPRQVDKTGALDIVIPEGAGYQTYFFQVEAEGELRDAEGNRSRQTLNFTYVLHCEDMLDLSLELKWEKFDGKQSKVTCLADKAVYRTLESGELENGRFAYTVNLTGSLAASAELVSGSYRSLSGESGDLDLEGGILQLRFPEKQQQETYVLTFHAKLDDRTVSYTVTLEYRDVVSVRMNVKHYVRDVTPVSNLCQSGDTIHLDIKNNQIRGAGALLELELQGEDAEGAIFNSVSYTSGNGEGGVLESSQGPGMPYRFRLGMDLYDAPVNTYTITAIVLAMGETLTYTINITYSADVSLQMQYSLLDGSRQQIVCENGKEKTAENIYTDQLPEGMLAYTMNVGGEDSAIRITKVSCYQSGDRRNKRLEATDSIPLLLSGKKTGENTFTVTAEDEDGGSYQFIINIPYKNRGDKNVKFWTSLNDNDRVINETPNNFSVRAWSEDESGKLISTIRHGGEQKLTVTLDGVLVHMTTTAGDTMEYDLYPSNPETGDNNTHTIHIYAEDEYGNNGEKTILLQGQRRQAGQALGKATVQVDLTVLGLGVESVEYTVLADEPTSYTVAKAVWGHNAGDPFGYAENSLGWRSGSYDGTLAEGFYLSRLYYGGNINAKALTCGSWRELGSTDETILAAIDAHFGEGTALAALWRCIYRNDLEKSTGQPDSIGDFDYTNGSGWIYSLNGSYFPGESMCAYYLRDGDVLTLKYTLANGWDVGSGVAERRGEYGYCVQAVNGRLDLQHDWEPITNGAGESIGNRCSCCGTETLCTHENAAYRNLGDGTHVLYCDACDKQIGDPEEHRWSLESLENPNYHTCEICQLSLEHRMHDVSDTATCTVMGTLTSICWDCSRVQEVQYMKEHQYQGTDHDEWGHWLVCRMCNVQVNYSAHSYGYYDFSNGGWLCSCGIAHGMEYCRGIFLEDGDPVAVTCMLKTYYCDNCGGYFYMEGTFPEYHSYSPETGYCVHGCGSQDPNYIPPETPPEEETEE